MLSHIYFLILGAKAIAVARCYGVLSMLSLLIIALGLVCGGVGYRSRLSCY